MRQRVFAFVDRAERLDRTFKLVIALATVGSIAFFLTALSPGRYLSGWVAARARWLAMQAVGLPPDRGEIDADWKRKRLFDIEQSRGTLAGTFAEYPPAMQRLLRVRRASTPTMPWFAGATSIGPCSCRRRSSSRRDRPVLPVPAEHALDLGPQLSDERTGEGLFSGPRHARARRDRQGNGGPDRRRIDPDDQFMGPARPRARSDGAPGGESSWATLTCRACSSAIDETPVECLKRDLQGAAGRHRSRS